MFREVPKSATTEFPNTGFRVFPWLPKPASPEPAIDESVSSGSTNVDDDDEAQRGFDWETQYHKLPLTILGLWPQTGQFTHLRFLLCSVLIWTITLPSFARVAIDTSSGAPDDLKANLTEAFPLFYTVAQYSVFKGKRSKVKIILETIHKNWRNSTKLAADEKKPMFVYGGRTRMITALCMGFYLVSCIGYFAEPLIKTVSKGQLSVKKLATHGVYPFPTNVSPTYEIVYALQALQGTLCALSITSIDGFLLLSAFHGCGQLSLLCGTICRYEGRTRHTTSSGDASRTITGCPCLECIVDRHVSLAQYVKTIDDIFHGIIMARLVMNTAHFCGVGYSIVKSNQTSNFGDVALNIVYMITMTSNLFMYCWVGEQLLTKGEDVGKAVYELRWYSAEAKVARSLMMPIMRSRRPMQVTAGKFFVMSFSCYKEWFMKSMGYLSVLLAIKSHN